MTIVSGWGVHKREARQLAAQICGITLAVLGVVLSARRLRCLRSQRGQECPRHTARCRAALDWTGSFGFAQDRLRPVPTRAVPIRTGMTQLCKLPLAFVGEQWYKR